MRHRSVHHQKRETITARWIGPSWFAFLSFSRVVNVPDRSRIPETKILVNFPCSARIIQKEICPTRAQIEYCELVQSQVTTGTAGERRVRKEPRDLEQTPTAEFRFRAEENMRVDHVRIKISCPCGTLIKRSFTTSRQMYQQAAISPELALDVESFELPCESRLSFRTACASYVQRTGDSGEFVPDIT